LSTTWQCLIRDCHAWDHKEGWAEGFWTLDEVSNFMKKISPVQIPGVDPTIWATIVALILLERRFSLQQDEWELVAMKAETWLSMQSLPAGFDIQKLKEEAKKLV
jgi:hypothetical protein